MDLGFIIKNKNQWRKFMKSKLISLLLSTFLVVSVISGCSNNTANDSKETSANKEQASNNTSASRATFWAQQDMTNFL